MRKYFVGLAVGVVAAVLGMLIAVQRPQTPAPVNGYYVVAFGYLNGHAIAGKPLGHVKDLATCEKAAPDVEQALLQGAPEGAGISVVCVPIPDGPSAVAKPPAAAPAPGDSEGDGSYRPSFST